jgi:steroid 5-alpha reductase family enzyme
MTPGVSAVDAWISGLPWIGGPLFAVWVVSLLRRDASVIDVFWGPGFALAVAGYLSVLPQPGLRGVLLAGAVVLWAVRLGLHLGWRWLKKGEEDYRYAAMRASSPGTFPLRSLVTVFAFQGGLIWLFSGPMVPALAEPGSPSPVGWLGILVFVTGFLWEAIADLQLARFRADPGNRGRVLETGLWRYSRHPNYFGEALLWWGLGIVMFDAGAWAGLLTAAAINILVLRISGVPLLEPHLASSRPGYAEYAARTSRFIPMPPRKS